MGLWELMGLASKKSIDSLQNNLTEIRSQMNEMLNILAKDEKIIEVSKQLDETNKAIEILKEEVSKLGAQVSDEIKVAANEKITEVNCRFDQVNKNVVENKKAISELGVQLNKELKTVAKGEEITKVSHQVDEVNKEAEVLKEAISKLGVQLSEEMKIVAKGEEVTKVSRQVDEVNKEAISKLGKKIEHTEEELDRKISDSQKALEDLNMSTNEKMIKKSTQGLKGIKSEVEDMGILLKALAMQGISGEMEHIIK